MILRPPSLFQEGAAVQQILTSVALADNLIIWCKYIYINGFLYNLLGGLLLLLFLLLAIILFLCGWGLNNGFRFRFFLLFFLLGNKEAEHLLGLDHVVLINVEFIKDFVHLSFGHLISPSLEGVLEHLDVNLAFNIIGLKCLDDEVVGVIALAGHLLLEHLDHVVKGAGTSNLTQQAVELGLAHEDTDVVESTTEIVFVDGTILVDVHELEALFVHLDLFSGESALLILALSHCVCCESLFDGKLKLPC